MVRLGSSDTTFLDVVKSWMELFQILCWMLPFNCWTWLSSNNAWSVIWWYACSCVFHGKLSLNFPQYWNVSLRTIDSSSYGSQSWTNPLFQLEVFELWMKMFACNHWLLFGRWSIILAYEWDIWWWWVMLFIWYCDFSRNFSFLGLCSVCSY